MGNRVCCGHVYCRACNALCCVCCQSPTVNTCDQCRFYLDLIHWTGIVKTVGRLVGAGVSAGLTGACAFFSAGFLAPDAHGAGGIARDAVQATLDAEHLMGCSKCGHRIHTHVGLQCLRRDCNGLWRWCNGAGPHPRGHRG